MKTYLPLTAEEETIGKAVVNAAYVIHKELGPGLLEKVYETCFCHVLRKQGYFGRKINSGSYRFRSSDFS